MKEQITLKNKLSVGLQLIGLMLLLVIMHEAGHYVLYSLTHSESAIIGIGAVGIYVQYLTPPDMFSTLVTWGGFLFTLTLIPLVLKTELKTYGGRIIIAMFLIYGALEGVNALLDGRLGIMGIDILSMMWGMSYMVGELYITGGVRG